jgi:hypothetical protein
MYRKIFLNCKGIGISVSVDGAVEGSGVAPMEEEWDDGLVPVT